MRVVDFHGLSRAAQDHFVDSTAGTEPPSPVLIKTGGPRGHRLGWLLAGGALLGLIAVFVVGFGELGSSASVHALPIVAIWVGLAVAVVFGVLHAVAGERQIGGLAWKAGIYAFPTTTVDARTHSLRVFDLDELQRIEEVAGGLALVYPGERFVFEADAAAVSKAKSAIEQAQKSGPPSNPRERASQDPLAEPRMSSPLAPTHRRKRIIPAWAKLRGYLAPAAGVAVGAALFFGRNMVSDDRSFAAAKAKNDVPSYRAYLKHGKRHKSEVERTLLPRAELTDAEKTGTVDAILEFERSHPSSAIQGEVDEALKASLLAELEVAKKAGTLAAIAAFEAKRPKHGLDAEVKTAIHGVYVAAFEAFKTVANDKDPALLPFMQKLLNYAEAKRDPKVEIRLRQLPSQSLSRADKYVTKEPRFNGETSYPTRYLDGPKLLPIANAFAKDVADKLQAAFPAEILAFSVGAAVDADLPAVTVPTLFVSHNEEWTGSAFPSNRPRGIYVGVNYHFASTFRIPGDAKALDSKTLIAKSVPVKVVSDFSKVMQVPGEVEKAVYDSMSKDAFDTYEAKLLAGVFKGNGKK